MEFRRVLFRSEGERRLGADVVDGRLVEQLQRARPVSLADDGAHRAPRRDGVGHDGDERPDPFGLADEAHRDLAGDAKGPLAAHEQRGQVVAGHPLGRLAPEPHRLAAPGGKKPSPDSARPYTSSPSAVRMTRAFPSSRVSNSYGSTGSLIADRRRALPAGDL